MSDPKATSPASPRVKAVHFVHEQANPMNEVLQGSVGVRMVSAKEGLSITETARGVLLSGTKCTFLVPWDGVKRVEYDGKAAV